jgi:hypothetical protein
LHHGDRSGIEGPFISRTAAVPESPGAGLSPSCFVLGPGPIDFKNAYVGTYPRVASIIEVEIDFELGTGYYHIGRYMAGEIKAQ